MNYTIRITCIIEKCEWNKCDLISVLIHLKCADADAFVVAFSIKLNWERKESSKHLWIISECTFHASFVHFNSIVQSCTLYGINDSLVDVNNANEQSIFLTILLLRFNSIVANGSKLSFFFLTRTQYVAHKVYVILNNSIFPNEM